MQDLLIDVIDGNSIVPNLDSQWGLYLGIAEVQQSHPLQTVPKLWLGKMIHTYATI